MIPFLDIGLLYSEIEFEIIGYWILDIGLLYSEIEFEIIWYWILDIGYWILDTGYWTVIFWNWVWDYITHGQCFHDITILLQCSQAICLCELAKSSSFCCYCRGNIKLLREYKTMPKLTALVGRLLFLDCCGGNWNKKLGSFMNLHNIGLNVSSLSHLIWEFLNRFKQSSYCKLMLNSETREKS